VRYLWLLLLAIVLFYWKILLTNQFSLLTGDEGVNQAYSWLRFWSASVRHGSLPIWDPYTLAGHSFSGEMQTAAFYPLHLFLALFPPADKFASWPRLYHLWIVFTHFLAACFMFALVREFGLGRFSALVAGLCYSLGGFVGRMGWPHMLESCIWLPLIFVFLRRAIRAGAARGAILHAAAAGLALGLSILAGGLHVVIMQVLAIVSAAAILPLAHDPANAAGRSPWLRAALVVAVIGAVGFAAGAVQLLPSIEYSHRAYRFLGADRALLASDKIPYDYLPDALLPNAFAAMLIPQAFNGNLGAGGVDNPYLGVFPLLLAAIGIWRNWSDLRVRYLAGLALAAFLYSMGPFSPLHGLLYALVPRLWLAREATRMVYLADFSFSILAAFGLESLLSAGGQAAAWTGFRRAASALAGACAAVLFVSAVFGHPQLDPWVAFSLLLILLSYGLFRYIAQGHSGPAVRVVMVGLILFDLAAFDWSARNRMLVARTGADHLERLLSCRGAVRFLESQPGPFRVAVDADPRPNIGDFFGIPTTSAAGVTMPIDFARFQGHPDLLNVRYRLAPASAQPPGAVYHDAAWKVYENPNAFPRAWLVHETVFEPSADAARSRLETPGFDARRTAVIDGQVALDPLAPGPPETVAFQALEANRLELKVHAQTRALLVLSETFYPGWSCTVNGSPARIYRADSALRGIAVPPGDSRIELRYSPQSVFAGGALTLAAFLGTLLALGLRRARPGFPPRAARPMLR
jgi:hypothetical protein